MNTIGIRLVARFRYGAEMPPPINTSTLLLANSGAMRSKFAGISFENGEAARGYAPRRSRELQIPSVLLQNRALLHSDPQHAKDMQWWACVFLGRAQVTAMPLRPQRSSEHATRRGSRHGQWFLGD